MKDVLKILLDVLIVIFSYSYGVYIKNVNFLNNQKVDTIVLFFIQEIMTTSLEIIHKDCHWCINPYNCFACYYNFP